MVAEADHLHQQGGPLAVDGVIKQRLLVLALFQVVNEIRLANQVRITSYNVCYTKLLRSRDTAAWFEAAVAVAGDALAKPCANWVMGELAARLNKAELDIAEAPLKPAQLARLVMRIADGTISNNAGKKVFDALWTGAGTEVDAIIQAEGLKQMNDTGELERIVDEVIAANPKSVA